MKRIVINIIYLALCIFGGGILIYLFLVKDILIYHHKYIYHCTSGGVRTIIGICVDEKLLQIISNYHHLKQIRRTSCCSNVKFSVLCSSVES